MHEDTARPQYETVEVDSPPDETVNRHPVGNPDVSVVDIEPQKDHPMRKFMFLIPAILIVVAIVLATYFTRTDFVQRPAEETNTTATELPTATPTPTKEPEQSLISFISEKYRFNYSRELTLYECGDGVYLSVITDASDLDFCGTPLSSGAAIKIRISNQSFNQSSVDVLSNEEVIVAGYKLDEIEYRASEGSNIFAELPFREEYYLFELYDLKLLNEFNDILGTFELIYDKTADWQFFENLEFGYSLKYPNNWILKIDLDKEGEIVSPDFMLSRVDNTDLQTLDVRFNTGDQNAALTASKIISSSRSLSGWESTPISEFRSVGGASATVVKGDFKGIWNTYVVVWFRNTVVEMVWQDDLDLKYEEEFELILSSFEFN